MAESKRQVLSPEQCSSIYSPSTKAPGKSRRKRQEDGEESSEVPSS